MNWLRRKLHWAKRKPLFWLNGFLVILCATVVFNLAGWHSPERWLRVLGMVLQLIGVATVWFDLSGTAQKFGKQGFSGFFSSTWSWLKECVTGTSAAAGGSVASLGIAVGSARGKARQQVRPEAPIPDRVTTLENIVEQIDADLDSAFQEIDKSADTLRNRIHVETVTREAAINQVRSSLKSAATDHYAPLAFGAFWLAVGIVFSSLAPEIATLAGGHETIVSAD